MELLYIIRVWLSEIIMNMALMPPGILSEKPSFMNIMHKILKFVSPFPLTINIRFDITTRCNLHCDFCYIKNHYNDISTSDVFRILFKIRYKTIKLGLLGGEPLLRGDLTDIIGFAKKRSHIKRVVLFTNAVLVTKDIASRLRQSGLDISIVNFSLDQIDSGTRKMIFNGIKNLVKAGIPVYTYTHINSENINRLDLIKRSSKELGAKPIFSKYVCQMESDPLIVENALWMAAKNRILNENPRHKRRINRTVLLMRNACFGGRLSFSVKANGDITPCPFIDDIIIGNALEGFENIEMNEQMRQFLSVPRECRFCSIHKYCGGGCRSDSKVMFGSYSKRDRSCSGPYTEAITGKDIIDKIPYFW